MTVTGPTNQSATGDAVADALARALGAQYQVGRVLGRGGMGVVYLAREPFLERDVAVKVLPGDTAAGDARERFLREARTAARLSHPNIVPLYTFGQADDLLYYVMGFVDGESLETRLQREGRLSADETRRVTAELADALAYAHSLGVVHRDIKPDNILLDRATGRAMLTDFGVAKQRVGAETLTQTGVIVGTPHYMSPEQGSGERDIDGRSDIYSLGVVAYRMATGRLPFEGSALREVLAQHATRAPVPLTQVVPTLPLDVVTAITRALEKDPADRWPDARTMLLSLSPESDESLPDDLRNQAGIGVNLSLVGFGTLELAFIGRLFNFFSLGESLGLAAIGLFLPAAAIFNGWGPAKRYGWKAALRVIFRQPSWAKGWWPRALRRQGDVWERLPQPVRAMRSLNVIMLPVMVAFGNYILVAMRESFIVAHPTAHQMFRWLIWPTMLVIYAPLAYRALQLRRWTRESQLSKADSARMLHEATFGSSFWARPHIARLLGTATPQTTLQSGQTPEGLRREIDAFAREGASSPHATLYREAAEAAAVICAAVERADADIAQLARDADPRERARIEASIAALGDADPADSTAKSQMRELLDRQLALYRDLDSRRAELGERRAHLHEQLRVLGLQLARLRAEGSAGTAPAEVTATIQTICRDVEYRIAGAAEARALLS